MKRNVATLLISAAIGLAFTHSALASGTIHYKGSITESVCTVNVNGEGDTATVDLGEFATGDMITGTNIPATTFNIKVSDCPTSAVDHTTITLGGTPWQNESDSFFMTGAGNALGVRIKNVADNSVVKPNVTYPLEVVANVEKQFDYKADLHIANADIVQAGDISATLTISVAMD